MRFAFIAKHRHIWPVSWLCEALGVSRSGFHAWLSRADQRPRLATMTKLVLADRHELQGQRPHLWRPPRLARRSREGLACGLHRIERLMRANALKARPRRRGLPKDDGERSVIADNILDRDFQADRPNQKWLADFTYIWTAEGWLYVAVVLDLFSRRVVGWSMKADRDASARHGCPDDGGLAARKGRRSAASFGPGQPNIRASSSSGCWPTTASPAR